MTETPTLFDPSPLTRHRAPDRPTIHDIGSTRPILDVDPRRLARTDDPPTSTAGATSVRYRAGSQKAVLLAVFADAAGPITDAEAAVACGLAAKPGCCWWHRCSDLRTDGLIVQTGTGISPVTGEQAMLSEITDAGRRTVEQLRSR